MSDIETMIEHPLAMTGQNVLAILSGNKTVTRRPFDIRRAGVRIADRTVASEMPFSHVIPLIAGRTYHCEQNQHGAVSGLTKELKLVGSVRNKKLTPCLLGLKPDEFEWVSPWGGRGDLIWIRESHRLVDCTFQHPDKCPGHVWYEADQSGAKNASLNKLRPPMFMPRWASRIQLELTSVTRSRLHDMTGSEAKLEGIQRDGQYWLGGPHKVKGTQKCFNSPLEAYQDLYGSIYGRDVWAANPWVWRLEFQMLASK